MFLTSNPQIHFCFVLSSEPNHFYLFILSMLWLVIMMQVNFIIPFTLLVMNKFTAYYFGLDLWQNTTGTNNLICQPFYKDSSISVTHPNLKSKVHLTARARTWLELQVQRIAWDRTAIRLLTPLENTLCSLGLACIFWYRSISNLLFIRNACNIHLADQR